MFDLSVDDLSVDDVSVDHLSADDISVNYVDDLSVDDVENRSVDGLLMRPAETTDWILPEKQKRLRQATEGSTRSVRAVYRYIVDRDLQHPMRAYPPWPTLTVLYI